MFSQLLERQAYCDVTLACEGKTLRAHKVSEHGADDCSDVTFGLTADASSSRHSLPFQDYLQVGLVNSLSFAGLSNLRYLNCEIDKERESGTRMTGEILRIEKM